MAIPIAMPVISRAVPAYTNDDYSGAFPASHANDSTYGGSGYWRCVTAPIGNANSGTLTQAVYLAYDLSGVSSAQRQNVVIVWYNDPSTGAYDSTILAVNYNNSPAAYTIDTNTAAGGSYPGSGWTTQVTVTGETRHSRQHAFNLNGANWIRINITAINGSPSNNNVALNVDVHDASGGNQDNWIFYGDSITQRGLDHDDVFIPGTLPAQINTLHSANFPLMENGGIGGQKASDIVANNYMATWLPLFSGKYVGLNYGTNDANAGGSPVTNFLSNMTTLVQAVIAAGKIPVIHKTIPWGSAAGIAANGPAINTALASLFASFPSIVQGPDLWAYFNAHQSLISNDGIHPTEPALSQGNGYIAYRQQWAASLYSTIYTGGPLMTTPPSNANPEFTETQTPLYDPAGHQFVAERAYSVATDATTNIVYGDPATGSGGGGGGAVTVADGADVTQGTSTDANTVASVMGRLTKIRDLLNATLTVAGSGNFTVAQATGSNLHAVLDAGSAVIGHVIADSGSTTAVTALPAIPAGTNVIGHVIADTGSTTAVTSLPALAAGSAVIGHVIADSGSTTAVTSLPAIPTGANVIGHVINDAGSALMGGAYLVDSGGTNKATVDSNGNQTVKGNFAEQASLTIGSLNGDLVPSTDVSAYKWAVLQINAVATGGVLTFQGSNDNSTFNSVAAYSIDGIGALTTTTSTAKIYAIPVSFRYLRIRQTSWTSGNTTGTLELYTFPLSIFPGIQAVSQNGTWTVQPGNTQNTTPWLTAGPTSNATQAANTAANTVVKGSAGYLWSATVTATGTAELDIYDNASTNSGTKLLAIPANAAVGTIYSFQGGARASSGITSGGVTNCPAVTFFYS